MDESRFRELFDATYPALAQYARRRGLTRDDAEDLIASTYEVAWRRVEVVPQGDEALLWLYTVAFNHLRNLRRHQQRDLNLIARLPLPEVVPPPSEPDDVTVDAIRRALGSLTPDDRELILLIAAEGLTAAQAGAIVGCGVVAARTRLHRARKRLAVFLGSESDLQRLVPVRHEQGENDNPWEALK